jgi:cellobiose-specific phosphotransferase system component IIC
MDIQNYIDQEMKMLDRGIVATPENREYLESFAKANQGSMDILLMQMAMNFGYKLALENVQDICKQNTTE